MSDILKLGLPLLDDSPGSPNQVHFYRWAHDIQMVIMGYGGLYSVFTARPKEGGGYDLVEDLRDNILIDEVRAFVQAKINLEFPSCVLCEGWGVLEAIQPEPAEPCPTCIANGMCPNCSESEAHPGDLIEDNSCPKCGWVWGATPWRFEAEKDSAADEALNE